MEEHTLFTQYTEYTYKNAASVDPSIQRTTGKAVQLFL